MPPPTKINLRGVNFSRLTWNFVRLFPASDWTFPPSFSLTEVIFNFGSHFYSKRSSPKIPYIVIKIWCFLIFSMLKIRNCRDFFISFQYLKMIFVEICINTEKLDLRTTILYSWIWNWLPKGKKLQFSTIQYQDNTKILPKCTESSEGFFWNGRDP